MTKPEFIELLKVIGAIIASMAAPTIYFLPSIIAYERDHHKFWRLLALNIFLGITVIFWIVALVWAILGKQRPEDEDEEDYD
ncbi:MAG: superinfection immunity protein [Cytophagales bacterium]|nr:superinfection immunity protein [Cytophagales bacterium]